MKQNDNEKQRYEAPRLTAVSFRTERGFADSVDVNSVGNRTIFGREYSKTGEDMTDNGSIWSW